MATKKPVPELNLAEAKVSKVELLKEQIKAVNQIEKLKLEIVTGPIKNQDEYDAADRHRAAAKGMKKYFIGLLKVPLDKIKEAMEELKASRDVVVVDADAIIESETKRMEAYKLEERRLLRESQEAAAKESARLQAIADAKEAQARLATSKSARTRLENAAIVATVEARNVVAAPVAVVEAENSRDRYTFKCRVTDEQALITHIAKDLENLAGLLKVDPSQLNAYFKLCEPKVGAWMPGTEVYEDVTIVSRKGY